VLIEAAKFMVQKTLPKIWLLASPHSGDNTQLLALAEDLGWPLEIMRLNFRPWQKLARLVSPASLFGLTGESKRLLTPPYPDLIIGAGHATEPAAFWIQKRSGNTSRLVYVGTPLAPLENFDLVITTPQYGLPQHDNVLQNDLPIHKIDTTKLQEAALSWKHRLAHLPKPWTAILVGGNSGPYTFDAKSAQRLAREANTFGGSLLISTSARTPTETSTALRDAIACPNYFHEWNSGNNDNPYFGFLALADKIIVTADSISMLAEAVATRKPILMFDTEQGRQAMREPSTKIVWRGKTLYATIFRLAMRYCPPRWTRDLRIVHQNLIATGQAAWLGDKQITPQKTTEISALSKATSRVKALFELETPHE
jgi:uncharacterized protein